MGPSRAGHPHVPVSGRLDGTAEQAAAEQRGLVIRTRDPDDRRATWAELTTEGAAVQVHADDVSMRVNRLINHLPPKDQQRLTGVVQHLLAAEQEVLQVEG